MTDEERVHQLIQSTIVMGQMQEWAGTMGGISDRMQRAVEGAPELDLGPEFTTALRGIAQALEAILRSINYLGALNGLPPDDEE